MGKSRAQAIGPKPTMRLRGISQWLTARLPLETLLIAIASLVVALVLGWALAFENWYTAALVVLVASMPAVVRWPVVSTFGTYAFFIPFDAVSTIADAGGSSLTKLIGILSVAVLLADGVVRRRRLVCPPIAALWWGIFVLWAVLSAAWALDQSLVFQRLPTALSLFLLYLVAVSFKPSRRELHGVCVLAVLGGTIAAGTTYFTHTADTGVRGTLIVHGQAVNPNIVAVALILPLALGIGGYLGLRNILLRTAAMGAIGLISVGIYVTASRKALLAMIAMILVFIYRFGARWRIFVVVVLLLSLGAAMPDILNDRIQAVLGGEDVTGSGRTEIWGVGLQALERFGLFGAGLSNFTAVYGIYQSYGPSTGPPGAHNAYLGVWIELGLVGLALMLLAVGAHILAVSRYDAEGGENVVLRAIECACVGMLIVPFFADVLWSKEFWLLWILLTWALRTTIAGDYQEHRLPALGRADVDESPAPDPRVLSYPGRS